MQTGHLLNISGGVQLQWLDTDFTATCHLLHSGGIWLQSLHRNTETSMQLVIFWICGGGGWGPTAVTATKTQKHQCNWSSSEYWWWGIQLQWLDTGLHCNLSSSALRGGSDCSHCTETTETSMQLVIFWICGGGGWGPTAVTAQKHRNINATGHLLNIGGGGSNCSGLGTDFTATCHILHSGEVWLQSLHRNTETSMQLVIFWICRGGGSTAVSLLTVLTNYITAVLIKYICICIPSQDKLIFFRDNLCWLSWRPPVLFHMYWAMLPSLTDMGIWNKYSNNG